jgi:hypothetical protein
MRPITFEARNIAMGLAVMAALLSPATASAQSDLDVAEAQAFIGDWVVSIDSDFGPFALDLEIADISGKVGASVGSPDMGGPMQDVTDIVRTGEGLTLTWEVDAQGQLMEVLMILAPQGEGLSAMFTTAGGEFSASGVATRAQS